MATYSAQYQLGRASYKQWAIVFIHDSKRHPICSHQVTTNIHIKKWLKLVLHLPRAFKDLKIGGRRMKLNEKLQRLAAVPNCTECGISHTAHCAATSHAGAIRILFVHTTFSQHRLARPFRNRTIHLPPCLFASSCDNTKKRAEGSKYKYVEVMWSEYQKQSNWETPKMH